MPIFGLHSSIFLAAYVAAASMTTRVAPETVPSLAEDIAYVVSTEDPIDFPGRDPDEDRVDTATLTTKWIGWESGGDEKAVGDAGRSCGAGQVQPHLVGTTCAALTSSRRFAIRVTVVLMRELVRRCGSVRAGLGAYAGGTCGARAELVARRCRDAGVC